MGFMDILRQYGNAEPGQPSPDAARHFEQVAQEAPPDVVSQGLADAFRADQTPPFGEMVGQLFGNSDPQQRAGVLNQLLGALGPGLLGAGAGGALGDLMRRLGGGSTVTPEQAQAITPEQVQEVAHRAEQQNPSIIDKVSDFYAQHPGLVKTLGSAALAIALARMAQRR
jgi:hypothetical protein